MRLMRYGGREDRIPGYMGGRGFFVFLGEIWDIYLINIYSQPLDKNTRINLKSNYSLN